MQLSTFFVSSIKKTNVYGGIPNNSLPSLIFNIVIHFEGVKGRKSSSTQRASSYKSYS